MFNLSEVSKYLSVCRYSATSSGGRINEDVQSLIFSFAASAAVLVFLGGRFLDGNSFFSLDS